MVPPTVPGRYALSVERLGDSPGRTGQRDARRESYRTSASWRMTAFVTAGGGVTRRASRGSLPSCSRRTLSHRQVGWCGDQLSGLQAAAGPRVAALPFGGAAHRGPAAGDLPETSGASPRPLAVRRRGRRRVRQETNRRGHSAWNRRVPCDRRGLGPMASARSPSPDRRWLLGRWRVSSPPGLGRRIGHGFSRAGRSDSAAGRAARLVWSLSKTLALPSEGRGASTPRDRAAPRPVNFSDCVRHSHG
jgi:hypothetical protein